MKLFSEEEVRRRASLHGFKLIGGYENYKNVDSKLDFECFKGHQFETSVNEVHLGCKVCGSGQSPKVLKMAKSNIVAVCNLCGKTLEVGDEYQKSSGPHKKYICHIDCKFERFHDLPDDPLAEFLTRILFNRNFYCIWKYWWRKDDSNVYGVAEYDGKKYIMQIEELEDDSVLVNITRGHGDCGIFLCTGKFYMNFFQGIDGVKDNAYIFVGLNGVRYRTFKKVASTNFEVPDFSDRRGYFNKIVDSKSCHPCRKCESLIYRHETKCSNCGIDIEWLKYVSPDEWSDKGVFINRDGRKSYHIKPRIVTDADEDDEELIRFKKLMS